ncbi:MAG: GNAT family N-acetyltransferase [Proteobacteria bacterium]|nr:GNAT family N-acetyltransferase [Pseudomonadota bacterium]
MAEQQPDVFRVRPAASADLARIIEIQREAFRREAVRYGDYRMPAMTETLAELAAQAQRNVVLTCCVGDDVVGSVRGHLDGMGIAHLDRLVVLPKWEHHGAAKRLMDEIEQRLNACSRYRILAGEHSERVIRLCGRRGYRPCGYRSAGAYRWLLMERLNPPSLPGVCSRTGPLRSMGRPGHTTVPK